MLAAGLAVTAAMVGAKLDGATAATWGQSLAPVLASSGVVLFLQLSVYVRPVAGRPPSRWAETQPETAEMIAPPPRRAAAGPPSRGVCAAATARQ